MGKLLSGCVALGIALLPCVAGRAQDYPNKPVSIVVPYAAGGGVDRLARVVAEQLHEAWHTPVIVENRSGANGNIGAEYVARSAPDGYTLLYSPPGPLAINKMLYKLNFDPDALVPITVIATSPNVLVIHPKLGIKTVEQLIAFAKANPGKLNYASPGTGGTPHLSAELLKSMAGISMVHVPYRGTGPLMADMLAGNVDLTFSELGNILPYVQAGKLRALAVASAKRSPYLPDVPTMTTTLPGFISATWSGLAGPPGTPPAIVQKVYGTLAKSFKNSAVAKRVLETSHLEAVVSTPKEMAAQIANERERWRKVIQEVGLAAK